MPKNANENANSETNNSKKPSSEVTNSTKTQNLTINEKLAQLDTAVEWFYGDDFSLDQALDKYKSAAELAEEVKKDLAELKNKVEVLEDFTKS